MLPETVRTDRLIMRKPTLADASVLFESYGQDHEVCKFMTWEPMDEVSRAEAFLRGCIEDWDEGTRFAYVLAFRDQPDHMIGMLDAMLDGHMVELGYVLAKAQWRKGIMSEATIALTDQILATEPFFRVFASCDMENIGSQKTLEKAGFIREGKLSRYTIHPNISPEPRDCYLYARTRPESPS